MSKNSKILLNHGFLYENSYQKHDKQPSHTGEANVEGQLYKVKCWTKKKLNGKEYFSFLLEKSCTKQDLDSVMPIEQQNFPEKSNNYEQEF